MGVGVLARTFGWLRRVSHSTGCHTVSHTRDRPNRRKLAESNDPVPAQGRIYIGEQGPMLTRPGKDFNHLVLGLGYASILAKLVII